MSLNVNVLRYILFNNSIKSFINPIINPVQNFLKGIFKTKFMIYHSFSCWIKMNWSKFNFSIWLVFFNISFSVIWYLKPFASFKRLLNKSLIIDLLVSNCLIGYFFSIISTF